MTKLGIAVVGAGRIAHDHVRASRQVNGVEVVAAMDPDAKQVETFARTYRIPTATTRLDRVLQAPNVDAVIVCTPTATHHEVTLDAIAHGKHVLVEKPFAVEVDQAQGMVRSASDAGVQLLGVQMLRYMPMFTWAWEFIRAGKLGAPVQAIERRLTYRRDDFPWWRNLPYFLIAHWGSHSVDLLCHLLDDAAETAYCLGASVGTAFDIIDDFNLQLGFIGGLRAGVNMSFSSRLDVHDLVLVGEDATLEFSCYREVAVNGERALALPEDEMVGQAFKAQLQNFVDAIVGSAEPVSTGASILRSLAALVAAEKSLQTGSVAHVQAV